VQSKGELSVILNSIQDLVFSNPFIRSLSKDVCLFIIEKKKYILSFLCHCDLYERLRTDSTARSRPPNLSAPKPSSKRHIHPIQKIYF